MIAHWRSWGEPVAGPAGRIAQSLGMFAGRPAEVHPSPGRVWSHLAEPRPRYPARRGWRPATTAAGTTLLFHGWLDNRDEIAKELGISGASTGGVYGAAIDRWGPSADARLHGTYCAIAELQDGSIRLSRSPWAAPPLTYANNGHRAIIASVPRVLFAAGHPRRLNRHRFGDNLFYRMQLGEDGWYEGTFRVAYGSVVTLTPNRAASDSWYDPCAIPQIKLKRDEEYVEAAAALLGTAVDLALTEPRRPALALSGGLDSSLVADEICRRLPAGEELRSYTALPHPDWDGIVQPAMFGDERGYVEGFAAAHPRLRPTFLDRPEGGFDDMLEPMLAAMDIAPRNLANGAFQHAVWSAAAKDGCDWMLDAELGNVGLSNDGRWAYVEYLTRGRWGELARALRMRSDDPRPLWRKLAAMSVLPLLPRNVRAGIRRTIHPQRADLHGLVNLIRPEVIEDLGLDERAGREGRFTGEYPRDRAEAIRHAYEQTDVEGGEVTQAFEQVHGLRQRDVTAYRPLLEFCLGIPTDQFVRGGTDRYLARRLGIGRLPEEQRTNRRYGRHNADWHTRLSRRRTELRMEVERIRNDSELNALFDVDRMKALLDAWPAETPLDATTATPREVALTRSLIAARFLRFLNGRNAA